MPLGKQRRLCPLCGTRTEEFLPFPPPEHRLAEQAAKRSRPARCACGSLERHRAAWLYLLNETDLLHRSPAPKRFLHLAPERSFFRHLRGHPAIDYVPADLAPRYAQDVVRRWT